MPVLSNASVRDIMLGSTKAKKMYYGTKLVWEADQGPAALYPGTGWWKATDTGVIYCKGVPSLQTHTFAGDPKVYISVYTTTDILAYPDRAAISNVTSLAAVYVGLVVPANSSISSWDTSNVTIMSSAFWGSSAFNHDISRWNTSKVTNMSMMFNSASAFNKNISGWNVSNVTDMTMMFTNASVFNQNISSWNVSKVTKMDFMFSKATVFNQNLSKWCVTLIKTEPQYFRTSSALTAANTPRWGTCPAG